MELNAKEIYLTKNRKTPKKINFDSMQEQNAEIDSVENFENGKAVVVSRLVKEGYAKQDSDIFLQNLNGTEKTIISTNLMNDIDPKISGNNIAWIKIIQQPGEQSLAKLTVLNTQTNTKYSTDFQEFLQFDLSPEYIAWISFEGTKFCKLDK